MGITRNKYRVAGLALAGLVVFGSVSAYALNATSTMQFCASCHEMQVHEAELRFSSHAEDADGKPVTCSQCHIPAGFGPDYLAVKTYSGLKDVYVHFVEQPASLNRADLQEVARRFIDDDNCLKCHEDLYKDAKGENAISEIGRLSHDAYLGRNGQAKSNCAGCHINLAHLPEFDRRLVVNQEFKSRILNQEAVR